MTKTGVFIARTSWGILILLLLLEAFPVGASACTCWSAAGERALGGGTILAKNRDWEPQRDELKVVAPPGGLRYVALVAIPDGGKRRVVAGVNEKGLAVVSLSASSVPKKDRTIGAGGLNEKLLAGFDSVDAALGRKELLSAHRPAFLMLADGKRIAEVEIAPRGDVAVRVTDNGTLCHTNHYLDPKLVWANSKIGKSSARRLDRIRELVGGHPSPFGMEDFIAFSDDRHDGPDESIWRTGSTPEKTRTLAGWIVAVPRNGVPSLYVKLANPGEKERTYKVKLDQTVWSGSVDAWAPVPGRP
ncbi:MAG: carcinine hydrolase/isopenicillin-N N-acyltransferase family protein [Syntrophobacteraceae bacterium]|nr:C45 family peptidase [Desulfobacteraceae bacterium]